MWCIRSSFIMPGSVSVFDYLTILAHGCFVLSAYYLLPVLLITPPWGIHHPVHPAGWTIEPSPPPPPPSLLPFPFFSTSRACLKCLCSSLLFDERSPPSSLAPPLPVSSRQASADQQDMKLAEKTIAGLKSVQLNDGGMQKLLSFILACSGSSLAMDLRCKATLFSSTSSLSIAGCCKGAVQPADAFATREQVICCLAIKLSEETSAVSGLKMIIFVSAHFPCPFAPGRC